jgi:hypothetical protein
VVQFAIHLVGGEGHRSGVLGAVSKVPGPCHCGPSKRGEVAAVEWWWGSQRLGSFLLGLGG